MESIFNKCYNYNDYKNYLKSSLLPDDFQIMEEDLTNSITINLKLIDKIMMIGYVPSLDLTVYEFRVKNTNDPRVSLSREAFRVLSLFSKLRALVLFIPDNLDNYRLSLITIDLKLKNNGIEKIASNPKRFSYLLGTNAKMHTILENLYNKGRVNSFEDLLLRFSIESVNEEFYNEISNLFFILSGGVKKVKNRLIKTNAMIKLPLDNEEGYSEIKNFCVRLIGRIIFCWFLKKKKSSCGIPLVPYNILSSELVNKGDYYHSVLEKLFFEVLNKQLAERSVRSDQIIDWDKIPFLNGGLFDPTTHIDFYVSGVTNYAVKIPDQWFLKLFEVLERFNFTIDENTPIDIELSIDPEMLGRIFENLLAEINPDTQESARKATGSFYTPRPIVEYMVDESLIMFLKSKVNLKEDQLNSLFSYSEDLEDVTPEEKTQIIEAFDNLKIIDPACGSGAFPMGILQKIQLALQKIDPKSEKWLKKQLAKIPDSNLKQAVEEKMLNENNDFIHKLGIIQNCIYGVDIQPMAVEISKLRFFLTLIVDENIIDDKPNRNIHPLPNLSFKFVASNTLISLIDNNEQLLMLDFIDVFDPLIDKLSKIRDDFFYSSGTKKILLEKQFQDTQKEMLDILIKERSTNEKALKLSTWNPFRDDTTTWFDEKLMFGIKDGFDIIIGNPPYGAKYEKKYESYFKKYYKSAQTIKNVQKGSLDTFTLFIERSYNILKKNGCFINIVPISITSSDSMTALHRLLEKKCGIIKVSSYSVRPQPVFQNAVVNTSIFSFIKTETVCNEIWTTKMYRKNKKFDLNYLVKNLDFINSIEFKLRGRYPKISYSIERQILKKIFNQDNFILNLLGGNTPIYYRFAGGRYFKVITNYSTGSSAERAIYFPQRIANTIGAILSSNLFFWWYQIYSDNLNLKSFEIESFKIPNSCFNDEIIQKVEHIYKNYLEDIELNSNIRNTENYANISSFKEYKIGKSKNIIDQIDDIICPLYGLNAEEIEFIKNYEIEFRIHGEENSENEA